MVLSRAAPLALLVALAAALVVSILGNLRAAVVLTLTAVIGIISTSCLEGALSRILQPGKPRLTRGAAALLVAHLACWGVFLAALLRWGQRGELWAVAVGLGCFLLGLSLGGINIHGASPREE